MSNTLQQEDLTIEITGEVTGPPTIESILDKLRDAVAVKGTVYLSPGQVRVLHDHLQG